MRILITTAGSRGDVAPYTGLGRRLLPAGHQVAIATHGTVAPMVKAADLEARALSGDPRELVRVRTEPGPESVKRRAVAGFLRGMGEDVTRAPSGAPM